MRTFRIQPVQYSEETRALAIYVHQLMRESERLPIEEGEWRRRILEGDRSAEEKLAKHYSLLLVFVARQNLNKGMGLNELMGEGYFGLMRAARRSFKLGGPVFVSYALRCISNSMNAALKLRIRVITSSTNQRHREGAPNFISVSLQ